MTTPRCGSGSRRPSATASSRGARRSTRRVSEIPIGRARRARSRRRLAAAGLLPSLAARLPVGSGAARRRCRSRSDARRPRHRRRARRPPAHASCSTTCSGPGRRRSPSSAGSCRRRPGCGCWRRRAFPSRRHRSRLATRVAAASAVCPTRPSASSCASAASPTGDVTAITRRADGNPLLALFAVRRRAVDGRQPGGRRLPRPAARPARGARRRRPARAHHRHRAARAAHRHASSRAVARPARRGRRRPARPATTRSRSSTISCARPPRRRCPPHRRVVLHAAAATALQRRGDLLGAVDHVLQGFGALDADEAVEAVAAGCELLAERLAFEDLLVVATRLHSVVVTDHRCRPRHEAAALLLRVVGVRAAGRRAPAQGRRPRRRAHRPGRRRRHAARRSGALARRLRRGGTRRSATPSSSSTPLSASCPTTTPPAGRA